MNCKKCGHPISSGDLFCPACGEAVNTIPVEKNKGISPLLIIVFLVIGLVIGFITGTRYAKTNCKCKDDETSIDTTTENSQEKYTFEKFNPDGIEFIAEDDEELTKNIKFNKTFFNPKYVDYGKTRDAYTYGKNNNSVPVHISITITYYDNKGYQLDKKTSNTYVAANSEIVLNNMYAIKDDSSYDTVKITYKASNLKSYETNIELSKFKLEQLEVNGDITVSVTNNSDKKVYARVACIYYKNGEVVFADENLVSIDSDAKEGTKFHSIILRLGSNYNDKTIEYDDTKVFLQGAYNSDSTNY